MESIGRQSKRPRLDSTEQESANESEVALENEWADELPEMSTLNPTFNEATASVNNGDKAAAECGTIQKVTLFNFMCHERFEIKFGPRINFVQGSNGSGKSAILTSIIVALGGRAHDTSRGQSMKSFVKTGQTRAKVVVSLCNRNDSDSNSSYKYNEYGDVINVERSFNSDGQSSYCLKSKSNSIVSTKREELDNIIRHFNIQVTNPVVVLSQEVSRNFLNSKNPRDKYNFFMRATQLEQLKSDYSLAEDLCKRAASTLSEQREMLPGLQKESNSLEKKMKMLNSLCDQKRNLKSLMKEMLWAGVRDKESEIKELQHAIDERKSRIESIKLNKEKCEGECRENDQKKEALKTELVTLAQEISNLRAEADRFRSETEKLKRWLRESELQVNRSKVELKRCNSDQKLLEAKIAALKSQLCDESQLMLERNKRLESIADLEQQKISTNDELKSLQQSSEELRSKGYKVNDSISGMEKDIQHYANEIKRRESEVWNLERSRSNKLRRFGEYMPELVKAIDDEAHRFSQKPLGPIGAFLNLANSNCALATECCLKQLLFSFCCDNFEDERVLRQIMFKVIRKGQKHPTIITRKFKQRHDVSGREVVHEKFRSFLQLVSVKEDAIMNVLIDKAQIENTLFIPDYDECTAILSNINTVPQNCRQSFTEDGSHMYPVSARSAFRSYANTFSTTARYLKENVDEQINDLKSAIVGLQQALENRTKEKNELTKERNTIKTELECNTSRLNALRQKLKEIDYNLSKLKNVEEPTSAEITALEEELDTCLKKMEKSQASLEEESKQLNEIKEKIISAENDENRKEEELKEQLDKRLPIKDELLKVDKILTLKKNEISKLDSTLKEELRLQHENESQCRSCEDELEVRRNRATNDCGTERIVTVKSIETLKKEIEEIKAFLRESENFIGNKEEIVENFKKVKKHYKSVTSAIKAFSKYLEEFKEAMTNRATAYVELRTWVGYQASMMFDFALEQVNFRGQLCIYHKEKKDKNNVVHKAKTIEILVNPKVNHQSRACNNTKLLSGGERAYSTVGFLLALWESCQAPFRISDEFDCFMDGFNRKIALDTVLGAIKNKPSKQYIFFTPLPLDKYSNDTDIKVFRMPEPERRHV